MAAWDDQEFLACLDQIYQAALDPAQWQTALATLGRELRSEVSAIFVQDMASNSVGFLESVGQTPDTLTAYRDRYSKVNIWLDKTRDLPAGKLIHTPELVDDAALLQSEFYNDWLRPQGAFYSLGCTVLRDPAIETHVTLLRSRHTGPYSAEEQMLFAQLTTHIRRAIEIYRRVHTSDLLHAGIWQRFERMSVGVMTVDEECRLRFANPAAERILRDNDGLLVRAGRLTAALPDDALALGQHIAEALHPARQSDVSDTGFIALQRRSGRRLSILVCRMPRSETLGIGLIERGALLFIHAEQPEAALRERDLIALCGLTRAEAKLMLALLNGQQLADYAETAQISVNTAKSYLKQVFAKTGARRQADLFRRVLANPLLQFDR